MTAAMPTVTGFLWRCLPTLAPFSGRAELRHLPMHEAHRTRVVASLATLLTPHLRDRMPGPGDLDGTGPLEVSSTPDPTPTEGDGDGQ
jgi:hypothetical protein